MIHLVISCPQCRVTTQANLIYNMLCQKDKHCVTTSECMSAYPSPQSVAPVWPEVSLPKASHSAESNP